MIGGTVLKTITSKEHITLVVQGVQEESRQVLHVDVEGGADVETGDEVWWQCGEVFVTRGSKFEKVFRDKPCKKIGYSYGGYNLPIS